MVGEALSTGGPVHHRGRPLGSEAQVLLSQSSSGKESTAMSKLEISPDLLRALQELSSLLESEDALDRTLNAVVTLATVALPGCDSAGVTLNIA